MAKHAGIIPLSQEQDRRNAKAAAFLESELGVKVDAKRIGEHIETLIQCISDGWSLAQFALRYGTVRQTAKGKTVPGGHIQRRWRLADYLHATVANEEFHNKLRAGLGMTSPAAAALCSTLKPELIKLGLVSGKGRTADSTVKRAAQALHRAAKRIKAWEVKGIKATAGATADVPPFAAVAGMRLALDGATVETLVKFLDKPAEGTGTEQPTGTTPPVVRKRTRKPTEQAAAVVVNG